MKIYHNPRCRKSRETLSLLREKGIHPKVIEYLKTPPSEEELKEIITMLGIPAEKLLRKNEVIYKENYKGSDFSDAEWIKVMVENPKLIERPIVISNNQAVIGRPPSNIDKLID